MLSGEKNLFKTIGWYIKKYMKSNNFKVVYNIFSLTTMLKNILYT